MASKIIPESPAPSMLEIGLNIGGMVNFANSQELRKFTVAQSDRLASLLYVLKECAEHAESMYHIDVMQIASDMAFEVKQAVALLASAEMAHV